MHSTNTFFHLFISADRMARCTTPKQPNRNRSSHETYTRKYKIMIWIFWVRGWNWNRHWNRHSSPIREVNIWWFFFGVTKRNVALGIMWHLQSEYNENTVVIQSDAWWYRIRMRNHLLSGSCEHSSKLGKLNYSCLMALHKLWTGSTKMYECVAWLF